MRRLLVILLTVALPGMAGAAEICVQNQTEERLLFLAEGTGRVLVYLEQGGELCTSEAETGNSRIGVFIDEDALEGCTRLTRAGQTETLIAFTEYDNCEWTETPRGF